MPKRIVKLEAGYNCRDLGGYVSQDGRTVKWGRLYRSGSLSHLTKADQAELARRKIVVDCDLRSRHEQDNFPDKLWPGSKLVDAHFYSESGDEEEEAEAMVYQQNLVVPRTGLVMREIFKEMLDLEDDEALLYHCSMGKDRTGMVSVIVLMALGLEDREILRDYLHSREYSWDWDEADENDRLGQQIAKMNQTQVSQTAFYGITETIRQTWGGFDRYFASLGFDQGDLDRLRDKFLE